MVCDRLLRLPESVMRVDEPPATTLRGATCLRLSGRTRPSTVGVGTYPGSCPDVPRLPPPLGGLPTGLCSTIVCCVPPAARLRSQVYGYKLASTADPLAAWQSSLQTTLPADTSTPRETPTHPGRQLPDRRDNLFPVGPCPPGLISRRRHPKRAGQPLSRKGASTGRQQISVRVRVHQMLV